MVKYFPNTVINFERVDQSKGLTTKQAEEIRKVSGYNRLTPQKETPKWVLYLK